MLVLFSICNPAFAQGNNTENKSRAIIIVPGVLSSGLFYNGETNSRYYENEALWLGVADSKIRTLKAIFKLFNYNSDLYCDENGIPSNKNVGLPCNNDFPTIYDEQIFKYGVFSCYKSALDLMEKNFGKNTPYHSKALLYNYLRVFFQRQLSLSSEFFSIYLNDSN